MEIRWLKLFGIDMDEPLEEKQQKNPNKKLLKECVVVAYIINVHSAYYILCTLYILCRLKVSLDLVL